MRKEADKMEHIPACVSSGCAGTRLREPPPWERWYRPYAQVLLDAAAGFRSGDLLVINGAPWDFPFIREVEREAYRRGARYVRCDYIDPLRDYFRCRESKEGYLSCRPEWISEYMCSYVRDGAVILDLTPPVFGAPDVDPKRMAKVRKEEAGHRVSYNKARAQAGTVWVKTSLPTREWARAVYPNLGEEEAFLRLWETLAHIVRLDQKDPAEAWIRHKNHLKRKKECLDRMGIRQLLFEGPETELTVELLPGSLWTGGCDKSSISGREYIPNIPTEELFAVPHKYGVNGTVAATMPLNYKGSLIRGMRLCVRDGQVTDCSAEEGEEALVGILETDGGSSRFGEAALVPVTSPVYQTGTVFFNTILDENAVCHLALGNALVSGVLGADRMTEEEKEKAGINQSSIHVDFMIGSESVNVTAVDGKGNTLRLMDGGRWKI